MNGRHSAQIKYTEQIALNLLLMNQIMKRNEMSAHSIIAVEEALE